jgi:hypothetical protein
MLRRLAMPFKYSDTYAKPLLPTLYLIDTGVDTDHLHLCDFVRCPRLCMRPVRDNYS